MPIYPGFHSGGLSNESNRSDPNLFVKTWKVAVRISTKRKEAIKKKSLPSIENRQKDAFCSLKFSLMGYSVSIIKKLFLR